MGACTSRKRSIKKAPTVKSLQQRASSNIFTYEIEEIIKTEQFDTNNPLECLSETLISPLSRSPLFALRSPISVDNKHNNLPIPRSNLNVPFDSNESSSSYRTTPKASEPVEFLFYNSFDQKQHHQQQQKFKSTKLYSNWVDQFD